MCKKKLEPFCAFGASGVGFGAANVGFGAANVGFLAPSVELGGQFCK